MNQKHRNVDFDLGRRTAGERLWLARKALAMMDRHRTDLKKV